MSSKPKMFDSAKLTSLLQRGTAEARAAVQPLAVVPPETGDDGPEIEPAPAITAERGAVREHRPTHVAATTEQRQSDPSPATKALKRAITVRLTDDVLAALYLHQAKVRSNHATRLADTTIGGVIDTLLRQQLGLER